MELKFKQVGKNLNLSLPKEKTLTLCLNIKTERDVIKEKTLELMEKYNTTKSERSKTKILKELKLLYDKSEQDVEKEEKKVSVLEKVKNVVTGKSSATEGKKIIQESKSNQPAQSRFKGEF